MKKYLIIAIAFLSTSLAVGQGFNRWAIEGDFGAHAIGDESADLVDNYNHFGGVIRYNINPKFGLGLTYGKDNLSMVSNEGWRTNTEYNRYDLEAFVDIFDVLDLQNNFITILGHGGGGISTIDAHESNYYQSVFNMRGGLSALFKITRSVALKLDASTTVNISQDNTLDGWQDITNAGINSTVDNASAGLVIYLGKKGKDNKKRQHADWYVAPEVAPTVIQNTTILDRTVSPVHNNYTINYNYIPVEFVYFENDIDSVDIQGLNAIEKIYVYMLANPESKLRLTGSASPTESTTYEYDLDLSKRRVETIEAKFLALGLDSSRISTDYFGKFNDRNDLHEFARRVSLVVTK